MGARKTEQNVNSAWFSSVYLWFWHVAFNINTVVLSTAVCGHRNIFQLLNISSSNNNLARQHLLKENVIRFTQALQ